VPGCAWFAVVRFTWPIWIFPALVALASGKAALFTMNRSSGAAKGGGGAQSPSPHTDARGTSQTRQDIAALQTQLLRAQATRGASALAEATKLAGLASGEWMVPGAGTPRGHASQQQQQQQQQHQRQLMQQQMQQAQLQQLLMQQQGVAPPFYPQQFMGMGGMLGFVCVPLRLRIAFVSTPHAICAFCMPQSFRSQRWPRVKHEVARTC